MPTAVFFIPAAKGAQATPNKKEKRMKRNFFRWFVVSLFALGFGVAAQAQEPDRLVVNVPYDFMVNGTTLPAGKYDVRRSSDIDLHILSISSFENHVHAVTLATDVDQARDVRPGATFARTGDLSVLTKIQTADHVFTIPVPRSAKQAIASAQDSYVTGTSEMPKR